jgi:protein-S-isoprenylcysteine O-methyltransferase Ste14
VIDRVRYVLGVVHVIVVPLGVLYWFIIHLGARSWRIWGPARTYATVLPVLTMLGVWLYHIRAQLLGVDLGANGILIGVGLTLWCLSTWLELKNLQQVSIATLIGIPELSQQHGGRLLRDGSYGIVRHPRYLSASIGLLATLLIVNYLGLYIVVLSALPPGCLMLALEERELVDRFGTAYEEYKREVPQFIPRWRRRPQNPSDKPAER